MTRGSPASVCGAWVAMMYLHLIHTLATHLKPRAGLVLATTRGRNGSNRAKLVATNKDQKRAKMEMKVNWYKNRETQHLIVSLTSFSWRRGVDSSFDIASALPMSETKIPGNEVLELGIKPVRVAKRPGAWQKGMRRLKALSTLTKVWIVGLLTELVDPESIRNNANWCFYSHLVTIVTWQYNSACELLMAADSTLACSFPF